MATRIKHRFGLQIGLQIFFVCTCCWIISAESPAAASLSSVTVVPENPTTVDEVGLVITGWFLTPCHEIVDLVLHTIGEFEFQLDILTVNPDENCVQILSPFEAEYTLGILVEGAYQVLVIEYIGGIAGWYPVDQLLATFQVEAPVSRDAATWGTVKATYR